MWPVTLSGRLLIVALVGRYLTNQLIRRGSISYHRSFSHCIMRYRALMRYYQPFPAAIPCMRQVTHALLTRPPLSHKRLQTEVICLKCFVRLACVKHAASVHPEPGSNSHKNVFLSETHARLLTQLAKSLKARVLNPVSFELTSFNSFLILCLRIHSIA